MMSDLPKRAYAWNSKNIVWQEIGADGTKYALLEGRSDAAGEAFTYVNPTVKVSAGTIK